MVERTRIKIDMVLRYERCFNQCIFVWRAKTSMSPDGEEHTFMCGLLDREIGTTAVCMGQKFPEWCPLKSGDIIIKKESHG